MTLSILVEEGTISAETRSAARRGEIPPLLVCGVDLFVLPDSNDEIPDGASTWTMHDNPASQFLGPTYMHEIRFYEIIDLRSKNPPYHPYTDLDEVKQELKRRKARGASLLREEVESYCDVDSVYVRTPLSKEELADLLAA